MLSLLLKGRDNIGGSPRGLRSVDFSIEFRINRARTIRLSPEERKKAKEELKRIDKEEAVEDAVEAQFVEELEGVEVEEV